MGHNFKKALKRIQQFNTTILIFTLMFQDKVYQKVIKKETLSRWIVLILNQLWHINDGKNFFKLKMKKGILKLCQELDKEKSENPMMDISQTKALKIRQFIETIGEYDEYGNQKLQDIVSLKAKIVEVTEEHKIAMSLNAKI